MGDSEVAIGVGGDSEGAWETPPGWSESKTTKSPPCRPVWSPALVHLWRLFGVSHQKPAGVWGVSRARPAARTDLAQTSSEGM